MRGKKLAVFDFDSTLIEEEGIDEIAGLLGLETKKEIAAITRKVNEGELTIRQGFRIRLRKLAGLETSEIKKIAWRLRFKKGFRRLIVALHKRGYRLAIVSGGFGILFRELKKREPAMRLFDAILCNELGVKNGRLDGSFKANVVEDKDRYLRLLARRFGVEMENVVAVGDGALDKSMLEAAGLGVCLAGNPVAEKAADVVVPSSDLGGVLEAILEWEKSY